MDEEQPIFDPEPSTTQQYFFLTYQIIQGQTHASTVTGLDGHTPLPSDTANTMILADFVQDNVGQTGFTYAITAQKAGCTGTLTSVDPGPSWYRQEPEVPAHTVTITLLCDLPPAVMSYSPSGTGVAIVPSPAITFTEPVSRTTAEGAITISGGVSPTGFAWSNGDRTVTFALTPTLAYLTTYTVTVGPGVADLTGHLSTEPFSWQFTTQGKYDLYLPLVLRNF
ncbi:MAG: Ig-like domain-containing protein, partial [Actinomycetia bacterium]|nr:Ig-like domain-containing protein [Actinomycetes bacterium]